MTRLRVTLLLALLLVAPPVTAQAAPASASVSATGPDGDGAYTLTYDVTLAQAARVALGLDVTRTADGDTARATRSLGERDLAAGTTRVSVSFLPTEGAGSYAVALVVDGAAGDPLRFDVAEADAATAQVDFTVADEPTTLALTSDSVNADGKLKSPGEDLVTRATLQDANGWADLDGVRWRVDGNGFVDSGALAVNASPTATSVPLEHRYARSPIAAGAYRLTLEAVRDDDTVANASRTFAIREVAPVLLAGALPDAAIVPDADVRATATLTVGDRNGISSSGLIEARLYRGSTRVESAGLAVDLADSGNSTTLARATTAPDADGYARATLPLELHVPKGAAGGAYRVSIYLDGALAGSLPFNVTALPTLVDVHARAEDGDWVIGVNATGSGVVAASLADDDGAITTQRATIEDGAATLRLEAPSNATSFTWTLTLHARDDGPAVDTRAGWWNRTEDAPTLVLVPEKVGARLPATWRVEATGWNLTGASATFAFARWDGAPEPRLAGAFDGARLRIDGPPTLDAGRYSARAMLTLPNGTQAVASWTFETGPWMRLQAGAPAVEGREARVPVTNAGGVTVERFVIEVDAARGDFRNATLSWSANATATPLTPGANGRYVAQVDLAPGQAGELVLRLPDTPLPSGTLRANVRILALPSSSSSASSSSSSGGA